MKSLSLFVAGMLLFTQAGWAGAEGGADTFLKNKLNAVIDVLEERDLELQKKNKEIDDIAAPMFDFPLMAKLTLGKKFWPRLNEEERERFEALFIERFKKTYLDKIAEFGDEKILYERAVESEKKAEISTYLISKDKKTSILYKLYKSEADWKIYDVEIEGVSIIRSYRSQFSDVLEKGTPEDLLSKLEESIKSE